MPSKKQPRISQEALCQIAGTTVAERREWAKKKRLREAGRARYEEGDAVELAALRALVRSLGLSDAAIAWKQLRPLLAKRSAKGQLLALFDSQDKSASLQSSLDSLVGALSDGHPTLVVDIADPIRRVELAFQRLTADD